MADTLNQPPNGGKYTLLVQNLMAGLTVSFVALTLGAAFGILSGRGAFAGMLSAALIALVTSLFGGTRVQCSGPTAPMTAVTAVLVAFTFEELASHMPEVNTDHAINVGIILAGLMLFLMAILRLGKFINYIPNVVVSGFMNGIALLIWIGQIQRLFGLNGKEAFEGELVTNVAVTLITLFLLFFLPKFILPHAGKIGKIVSGTLLTLIIMTFASHFLSLDIERINLEASIHSFADLSNLVRDQWPSTVSWALIILLLPFAFKLAVLCYLDSLMTSLVVDKLTGEKTKHNQELFAQGLGNTFIAFLGGIPGAQATIRSVLIVKEKATWRLAGVFVGIFALVEMLLFQDILNFIPQAVFCGILFKAAYDVCDLLPIKLYIKQWKKKPSNMIKRPLSRHDEEPIFVTNREFLMIIGTTLVTVLVDLNIAVFSFMVLFYLHNKVLLRDNPMRDLVPNTETESFQKEG